MVVLLCSLTIVTGSLAATLEAQEADTGFSSPTAAVPTPDDGLLVTDHTECVVKKVSSTGAATVVAGTQGQCGSTGDGESATGPNTKLLFPTDAVPTPDGGFLVSSYFIVDCRVRKVSAAGIISTVAGNGTCGSSGDGGPATAAEIGVISVVPYNAPGAAVQTPGSGFLIAGGCEVRKVDGAGTITTVAGNKACGNEPPALLSIVCFTDFCAAGASSGLVATTNAPTAANAMWRNTRAEREMFRAIDDLSCPTTSFCAGTANTQVVVSNNASAAAPQWRQKTLAVRSISCPTSTFCLAGNSNNGGLMRSHNPGDVNPTWTQVTAGANNDSVPGVHCVSTSFCIKATLHRVISTSSNPAADSPDWTGEILPSGTGLTDVTCASTALCVVVGGDERLYVATDPADGDPTWTGQDLNGEPLMRDASCPTTGLCVAVGDQGTIFTSTNPTAADPSWTKQTVGTTQLTSVSCPTTSLCVAVAQGKSVVSTNPTAANPTWSVRDNFPDGANGVPATSQLLHTPTAAVPTADGGFLIAEVGDLGNVTPGAGSRIRKVSPNGTITTVAGTGVPGYSGDGGPATAAKLNQPTAAVPTPDGGFLISDLTNCLVRKVSAGGTITTVAGTVPSGGTPSCGTAGSGGSATAAQLFKPSAAVPVDDGSFVIGSYGTPPGSGTKNAPLNRVLPNGAMVSALDPDATGNPGGNNNNDGGGGGGGDTTPPPGGDPPAPGPAPPPGTPPGPGPGPAPSPPACTVKPASSTVGLRKRGRVAAGTLTLTVSCAQAATVRLAGKLKVTPKRTGRTRPKAKTVSLRTVTSTAQAGAALSLRMKVPKATLTALGKGATASASFTLTAAGAGGQSTATARIARLRARR
jgi:hypothetical protein